MALLAALTFLEGCDRATPSTERGSPAAAKRDRRSSESPATRGGVGSSSRPEVLSVAIRPPNTLDPMRIADPGSVLIARQLYEGLTRWDPVDRRVVPAVARSWRASRGGRAFTFELRRGMTFHDGSRVTAHSFRRAFDRIARKESGSDLAYTLEGIKGFYAVNQTGRRKHLTGAEALGAHTLRLTLTSPFYDFPAVLTHPGLAPVPRAAVRRPKRFRTRPIGNGPFELRGRWDGAGPVVLDAFADAIPTPDVGVIRFTSFADAARSWIPFTEGELDVAEVPAGETSAARETYGARGYVPLAAGVYFGLNVDSPNLRQRKLRVAITRAIDRRRIARGIFKGTLAPARGIVPPGIPGFTHDACKVCSYSPEVARRLVRQVPRRDRAVTVDFNADDLQSKVARTVKRDLERAGLRVRLRARPIGRYLRLLARGEPAVYRFGWIAEYPAPEVFLSTLFGSESPDNHSGFASDKVDALLARAHSEPGARARTKLYRRAEKLILDRVPVAPIGSFKMRWAAQPRVRDIHFDAMGGFDAASVRLRGD